MNTKASEDESLEPRTRGPSKTTQLAWQLAKATGDMPHEILLKMARGTIEHWVVSGKDAHGNELLERTWVCLDIDQRRDAAKAAAPYYAPKLSTVELISGMSDEELNEIIRGADEVIRNASANSGAGAGEAGDGEAVEAASGEGTVQADKVSLPRTRIPV